jgi:O-antigen/teichoic acid export membrane protein
VLSVLVGMTLFAACFNVYRGVGSAWRMTALYAGGNALQLAVVLAICGALGVLVPDLVLVVYSFAWLVVLAALELRAPLLRRGASSAAFGASATSSSATWIRSALGDLGRVWVALAVAQAAYTAWMWADIVLVEHYLGAAAAGHYGVARTLVMVLVLVPEAVTLLLLPHSAAEGQRARGLTARLLAMTAAVSAIGLLGLLVVAPVLLGLVADGRYLPAAAALPGLGVGMAIYALYMVLEGHLVGAGHARAHAAAIVVMATVTLGSAALLLPSLGLAGAGVAFVLGALAGLSTLLGIVFGFPRLWRAS